MKSLQAENRFAVARIVKKYSPLVSANTLNTNESSLDEIRKADKAVKTLFSLWDDDSDPSLIDSIDVVAASGLFAIPDVFAPILSHVELTEEENEPDDSAEASDHNLGSL